MIRVITIEREYGSGGADIARKLAERLGWKLWDHLLTDEIARQMECDSRAVEEHEERRDPLHYRLFKAFMRGSFEGSLNAPRLKMVDADCIREVAERVVTAAAKSGNSVIVGRGSAYYLHDRPDAFHVFVYAPLEAKVQRLRAAGNSKDFSGADPDKDKTLTKDEYLTVVEKRFKAADTDNDGTVSAEEFRTAAGRALTRLLH